MNNIIGNGLIATEFKKSDFDKNCLIFASGISNSSEKNASEFARENNLLLQVIKENKKRHLIYFSTSGIDNAPTSTYFGHKKNMENVIADLSKSYSIFRLPNIVGCAKNNTLISNFFISVLSGSKITIQSKATRNLLDVRDLARIVRVAINQRLGFNEINMLGSLNSISAEDLLIEISKLVEVAPKFQHIAEGYEEKINLEFVQKLLDPADIIFDGGYWRSILKLYAPWYKKNFRQFERGD